MPLLWCDADVCLCRKAGQRIVECPHLFGLIDMVLRCSTGVLAQALEEVLVVRQDAQAIWSIQPVVVPSSPLVVCACACAVESDILPCCFHSLAKALCRFVSPTRRLGLRKLDLALVA